MARHLLFFHTGKGREVMYLRALTHSEFIARYVTAMLVILQQKNLIIFHCISHQHGRHFIILSCTYSFLFPFMNFFLKILNDMRVVQNFLNRRDLFLHRNKTTVFIKDHFEVELDIECQINCGGCTKVAIHRYVFDRCKNA